MRSKSQPDLANTRGKGITSENKGDLRHATYGADSDNPLLWDLINARNYLELSRGTDSEKDSLPLALAPFAAASRPNLETLGSEILAYDDDPLTVDLVIAQNQLESCCTADLPKESLALSLFAIATRSGLDPFHTKAILGFFEVAAKAILDGDGEFFREAARLLEQRVGARPFERRVDVAVHHAFIELQSRSKSPPTKKQVRERALYLMATWNVMSRFGRRVAIEQVFEASAKASGEGRQAKVKKSLLSDIQKEVRRFPRQKWTRIFKRCGLSHLPKDKGGQPSHRKRVYCGLDS